MTITALLLVVGSVLAGFILLLVFKLIDARIPRRHLNQKRFMNRWRDLQKLCSKKETWPLAVLEADKLVEDALKRRHFRGKGMGERLVAAQRLFTDNDAVWTAHKLRNKVVHEDKKLREKEVKETLVAFRQALRDLGALK